MIAWLPSMEDTGISLTLSRLTAGRLDPRFSLPRRSSRLFLVLLSRDWIVGQWDPVLEVSSTLAIIKASPSGSNYIRISYFLVLSLSYASNAFLFFSWVVHKKKQ
jgi:hypothetical protein